MRKPAEPRDIFHSKSSGNSDNDGPVGNSTAKCPICKGRVEQRYRPFCSNRCAEIDLGRWLKGQYWIAGSREETDIVE